MHTGHTVTDANATAVNCHVRWSAKNPLLHSNTRRGKRNLRNWSWTQTDDFITTKLPDGNVLSLLMVSPLVQLQTDSLFCKYIIIDKTNYNQKSVISTHVHLKLMHGSVAKGLNKESTKAGLWLKEFILALTNFEKECNTQEEALLLFCLFQKYTSCKIWKYGASHTTGC